MSHLLTDPQDRTRLKFQHEKLPEIAYLLQEAIMSIQTQQDQYAEVGNTNTRFWGAGDAGTTVVLIHGSRGSCRELDAQHQYAGATSSCIRHRFGRSDKTQGLRWLSHGAQLVRVLDAAQAHAQGIVIKKYRDPGRHPQLVFFVGYSQASQNLC